MSNNGKSGMSGNRLKVIKLEIKFLPRNVFLEQGKLKTTKIAASISILRIKNMEKLEMIKYLN